jgi:DNA primase
VTAPASVRRVDAAALKRRQPLAEVVAAYGVVLRPSGRALVGRCPFHDDNLHPDLHVYPAADPTDDDWYCYGCNVGGDVIDFVMRREGLGFPAACERLGALPVRPAPPPAARPPAPPRPDRCWEGLPLEEQVVMDAAAAIYQQQLWREPRVLAYLRGRAIPDDVVRAAGLGYADGHTLEAYLRRRSGIKTALDLGLLRKPDRGAELREYFAGRLVVPELRGGHAVWFIGRRPVERPGRLKYLALDGERPVLGRELAIGQRAVFLCEGVFDYLTARAWGLPAVSPCGTHLPAARLAFLADAEVVYGVLDGDAAGRAAAERFGVHLGARWRPLWLPPGRDLNDLGRRPDGRELFARLLAAAQHHNRSEVNDGT